MNASHFTLQYDLIRGSRRVLLDYCQTISPADLMNENSSFGRGGSIRNLLVHIANTYQFWILHHAMEQEVVFTPYDSCNSMPEIEALFEAIDLQMSAFISRYEAAPLEQIAYTISGKEGNATALELFTHVVTHEFHHKGQVLSLSRHLGHVPVDTDVMR